MWLIITIFGFIGGYVSEKTNSKVSNLSFTIGSAAGTVYMLQRVDTANSYYGAGFYIVTTIILAILTIINFVGFMKKL